MTILGGMRLIRCIVGPQNWLLSCFRKPRALTVFGGTVFLLEPAGRHSLICRVDRILSLGEECLVVLSENV